MFRDKELFTNDFFSVEGNYVPHFCYCHNSNLAKHSRLSLELR